MWPLCWYSFINRSLFTRWTHARWNHCCSRPGENTFSNIKEKILWKKSLFYISASPLTLVIDFWFSSDLYLGVGSYHRLTLLYFCFYLALWKNHWRQSNPDRYLWRIGWSQITWYHWIFGQWTTTIWNLSDDNRRLSRRRHLNYNNSYTTW